MKGGKGRRKPLLPSVFRKCCVEPLSLLAVVVEEGSLHAIGERCFRLRALPHEMLERFDELID